MFDQHSFGLFFVNMAFRSWETQKGFPLIHVTTDDGNRRFTVAQEPYYAAGEPRTETERRWYIPLNYATQSNPNFADTSVEDHLVSEQVSRPVLYPEGFDSNQWFVFNKQQIGYYRVNYDTSNWNKLISVLNSDDFELIHVANRAQLIDDSLNMAADGYLDYYVAMGVLKYLSRETDYIPWRAAALNLDKLDYIMKDRPVYEFYSKFVKQLARRMYVTYGLVEKAGDTLMDKFARETAIDWTCRMGDERCLAETYEGLKKAVFDDEPIPASLEITYICNGIKGMNKQDEFVALWTKMQKSDEQSERLRIIDGLMCATDPQLVRSLLETTLSTNSDAYYRLHEKQRILNNIYIKSEVGVTIMSDFLVEYYEEFSEM